MDQDAHVPAELQRHLLENYAVSVKFLDSALGRLFAAIESSPEAANTIVVVVGDHGEQFGEHDLMQHGNSVYGQVLRVPLIVRGRGIAPARISEPVSTTGLYGTILQLAGIGRSQGPSLPLQGGSAVPVLSLYRAPRGLPARSGRQGVDASSVVAGSFHFIRYGNGLTAALRPLPPRGDDSRGRLKSLGYLH